MDEWTEMSSEKPTPRFLKLAPLIKPMGGVRRLTVAGILLTLLVLGSGCLSNGSEGAKIARAGKTVLWNPDGVIEPGEYQYRFNTDGFSAFFRVENDTLYVGIHAETRGWVAIGFGGGPGMKNTDIVIAYVLPNGTVKISDSYSAGFSGPHNPDVFLGGRADVLSYGGCEDENGTVVEFSRRLNTGDVSDSPIPLGKSFRVIWAYGPTDDFRSMHLKAGHFYVKLGGGS
jgi:hypothetical protein